MNLKINWDHKRCKHAVERMWLRGISSDEIRQAVTRGQKHRQSKTGLIEAMHTFYSVVYEEFVYDDIKLRKIYPVTVKLW